jgi:hypothetical protein
MRIGIDGTCLGSGRGYGRFLRELLPPLLAQADDHAHVLFVDAATAARVAPAMPVTLLETGAGQAAGLGARRAAAARHAAHGRGSRAADAFYSSIYSYFPLRPPMAIHDTIPSATGRSCSRAGRIVRCGGRSRAALSGAHDRRYPSTRGAKSLDLRYG